MTEYVYQPELPYGTYLEFGSQTEPAFGSDLNVASGEREETLVGAPSVGAPAEVVMERQEWHTGFDGVDFSFRWESCECLMERGQYAASAEVLKRGAKTGAHRWAIDQFDHAREAFRNRLYSVAFDHAQAALAGQPGQDGNRSDHRALFLLGLIRLGSFSQRDPTLLDLADAEDTFSNAGRAAASVHPTDAAWAHAAAGWAAYCRGRMDDALRHTLTALALRTKFGEAQYLAAKILLRHGQAEAAMAYFAAAIALHPSFARRALRDPDFSAGASKVDQVIQAERLRAAERANKALALALQRAVEIGVLEADQRKNVVLPPGTGAASATALLAIAPDLVAKNTLFGFVETEALATRAKDLLNAAVARSKLDQRTLGEAVRKAGQAIGQLAHFESEDYPLGAAALQQLAKSEALLAGTEIAVNAPTVRDFLLNHDRGKAALAEALQALRNCRRSALAEAQTKRAELDQELSRSFGADVAWERYILRGALVGFGAGMILAMLTGVSDVGDGGFKPLLRLGILAFSASVVGAILGALVGPLSNSHAISQRFQLETARTDLEETIDRLQSVAFGPATD